jgi:hypothetical protein
MAVPYGLPIGSKSSQVPSSSATRRMSWRKASDDQARDCGQQQRQRARLGQHGRRQEAVSAAAVGVEPDDLAAAVDAEGGGGAGPRHVDRLECEPRPGPGARGQGEDHRESQTSPHEEADHTGPPDPGVPNRRRGRTSPRGAGAVLGRPDIGWHRPEVLSRVKPDKGT